MRRLAYLVFFLCLALARTASADFTNPATLELKEVSPSQFEVVLTLPLINGRVLKAKPILPDICVIKGDLDERGVSGSVIRTWMMECNPDDLVGAPIGVAGLLGTSQEIQLTIETLDGRKYVQPLRPTQSFFAIPPSPTFAQLALDAGRKGIELVLRRPELVLLILLSGFLALRKGAFAAAVLAFAMAQALGQWLAGQNWMVMSPFLPRILTALAALLVAFEIVRGQSAAFVGWHRPLWIVMLLLGLLYGAAQPETVATMGLSRGEHTIAFVFVAIGAIAGLILLIFCVRELRSVLAGFFESIQEQLRFWIGYLSGVVACALFLYELSTLAFIGAFTPVVPIITLITAVVLGIWVKLQGGFRSSILALTAGVFFALGIILSFNGIAPPLATLVVFGFLVFLGTTILFPIRWPAWLLLIIVGLATVYHGYFAGQHLRDMTSLPVANAIGMGSLIAFLFYACNWAIPGALTGMARLPVRVGGVVVAGLALLWRLAEYREWFSEELAAEVAMGLVRLPVLAVILLLLAGLVWPRKRRFKSQLEGGPPMTHWALLALAFFVFPLGTWRVHNPFYTQRAPSTTEATHIIDKLLTSTYLAFNLQDENAAFDNLETNLSEDLVADVYLDSRRRLTAGTRQGAKVTVKDVSVMSVEAVTSALKGEKSFTYPCKWIVTARVQHLQHIHDRQNIYLGELTIRVEDDRWKITRLILKSEERVVLPWQRTS